MNLKKYVLTYLPRIKVIITTTFICLLMAGLTSCKEEQLQGGTIYIQNTGTGECHIKITDVNDNNFLNSIYTFFSEVDIKVYLDGYYKVYLSRTGPNTDYIFIQIIYVSGGNTVVVKINN
jgi:hypothetical protein